MSEVLHVAQLSDTHFLEPGLQPEGDHSYELTFSELAEIIARRSR